MGFASLVRRIAARAFYLRSGVVTHDALAKDAYGDRAKVKALHCYFCWRRRGNSHMVLMSELRCRSEFVNVITFTKFGNVRFVRG